MWVQELLGGKALSLFFFYIGFEPWKLWGSGDAGSHLGTTWSLRVKPNGEGGMVRWVFRNVSYFTFCLSSLSWIFCICTVSILTAIDCRRVPAAGAVLPWLRWGADTACWPLSTLEVSCVGAVPWIHSYSMRSSLLMRRNTPLFILFILLSHSEFFDFSPAPYLLFLEMIWENSR